MTRDTSNNSTTIDPAALSEVISEIYDCAIAPERWALTLELICEKMNFRCATVNLLDREKRITLIRQCTGLSSEWVDEYFAHQAQFGEEIHSVRKSFFEKLPIDQPMVLSRDVPREVYEKTRYYTDWLEPQGIIDVMQLRMLYQHDRFGAIAFGRHKRFGPFDERDIALASLLHPHLRRAMAISNLLEVQTLRANSFQTVVGSLSTAIILVAKDGSVLEANPAAERLLADGQIVCVSGGVLCASRLDQTELLRDTILSAVQGARNAVSGSLTLNSAGSGAVTAHVLPLITGTIRSNLCRTAAAAIFISPDANEYAKLPKADILSVVYDLTAAEKRVAEALADGKTSLQAAKVLGIGEATIRTHLTRIFNKTGVTRQGELISLMHRLSLPIRNDGRIEKK